MTARFPGEALSYPYTSAIDPLECRELATAFAWSMAHTLAADELPFFEEVAGDYWTDPVAATGRDRHGEQVGFGIDAAMTTTVLLAVASPVLDILGAALSDAVRESFTPRVTGWIRKIFRIGPPVADHVPRLTPDQLRAVRSATVQQAVKCGLQPPQAELLADAVIGATVTAGAET